MKRGTRHKGRQKQMEEELFMIQHDRKKSRKVDEDVNVLSCEDHHMEGLWLFLISLMTLYDNYTHQEKLD